MVSLSAYLLPVLYNSMMRYTLTCRTVITWLSVRLSVSLSFCLFVSLSVRLSVTLSFCFSVRLSVTLSFCFSVCLSVSP